MHLGYAQPVFSPDAYGAKHDVQTISDKSTTLSSGVTRIIVNGGWHFASSDIGKLVQIAGCGAAHGPHNSSIVAVIDSKTIDIADATVTATPTTPVQDSWFRMDYGTDDTQAVQQAINDASTVNGVVSLSAGTYWLSAALVIATSISFVGWGVQCQNGSVDDNSTITLDMPMQAPYLRGSVLLQTATGADALQITSRGLAVNLRGFGIRFSEGLRFGNTGHGINQLPPLTVGSVRDNGMLGATWENILVWGHDGNHYGVSMTNPLYTNLIGVCTFGGGGFYIEGNSSGSGLASYGGMTFIGCYAQVCAGGTAHAWHMNGNGTDLGDIVFARCQGTTADHGFTVAPTSAQKLFVARKLTDVVGGGQQGVYGLHFVAPDWESSIGGVVDIDDECIAFQGSGIVPGYPAGRSPTKIGGVLQLANIMPDNPMDREMWVDGDVLKIQLGGVTKTVTVT